MNKAVKSCLSAFALLLPLCAMSTNYSGEYYWNTDPGVGRALKMAVTDVGTDGKMQTTLDASSAAPGMNVLGMRVFNGRWSPTVVQYVFVPMDPESISAAICEYWWDADPGVGLGSQLTQATNGTGTITVDFDAASLTPGLHTLGFRTGIKGIWSPTVTRHVFVPQEPSSISQTVCEYWWDTDPGVGMCRDIVTASTNGSGAIDLDLKADSLSVGLHLLGIRSNINGHWSPTVTAPVFVRDNVVAIIDAAEYFWGDDPGFGNGTPINLTAAETVEIEDLVFDFPTDKQTEYVLTLRAHSSVGGWGYSLVKVFTPVEASGAIIDPEEYGFSNPDEEIILVATPVPANAWIDGFEWESSNTAVATVDSNGCVKSVAEGECVITARIKGTEYYAESKITVNGDNKYPLGDSNGSMDVTITDVATTVAYVLGNEVENFIFRAADVTKDGEISGADAVGTVNIIFGLPVASSETRIRAKAMAIDDFAHAEISEFCIKADGTGMLAIDLDNEMPLTAMQFDLRLPEGVEVASVTNSLRANGHKGVWNRLSDGSYRVLLYSGVSAPFSDDCGTLLQIELASDCVVESNATVRAYDVRVVECNSLEHSLPDMEAETGILSGANAIEAGELRIYTEGRILHIVSSQRTQVNMTTVEGIVRTLDVKEGDNSYPIMMPGVYIVDGVKVLIH